MRYKFRSDGMNNCYDDKTVVWKAWKSFGPLQWRHNEHHGVSNHQPGDCLLNRLFRRKSKKTSKLRVTGLCEGNTPVIFEFPAQRASNTENVSIWWRHHDEIIFIPYIALLGFRTCHISPISTLAVDELLFKPKTRMYQLHLNNYLPRKLPTALFILHT